MFKLWCFSRSATYVILMRYWCHSQTKIALNESFRILIYSEYQRNLFFFLLLTYRRKDAFNKCWYNRTIFHNKCELLKCCSYRKHLYQIHHNIRWNAFGCTKRKSEADSYVIRVFFAHRFSGSTVFLIILKPYEIYSRISNIWLYEIVWLSEYVTSDDVGY